MSRSIAHRSLTTASRLVPAVALALLLSGCSLKSQAPSDFADVAYPERNDGPELTAAQHEHLGDDLHESRSPEMAYVHYTRALASVGTGSEHAATLRVKRGLVLFSQGHDEAALKTFQQVLADHPDHALGNEAAGAVYLKAGLTKEARTHFEKAAALDASLWRTQQYLGVLASRVNDHELAIRHFTVSLELRPGQPGTLNNLGVARLMSAQYEEALAAFRSALAAGAPEAKIYNNIGLALARMGRTQEALQTFGFAGNEAQAHNNLGYVLMLQGENEQAIHHFEQAIKLSPSYYAKAFSNLKQARLASNFQGETRHPAPSESSPLPSTAPIPSSDLPEDSVKPTAAKPTPAAVPAPAETLGYVSFQPRPASGLSLRKEATSQAIIPTPVSLTSSQSSHDLYGLHVASFRSDKRTAKYVNELKAKGIETMVMQVTLDGTRWNRVLAGRFSTTSEATRARPGILTALGLQQAPITQFEDRSRSHPPAGKGASAL